MRILRDATRDGEVWCAIELGHQLRGWRGADFSEKRNRCVAHLAIRIAQATYYVCKRGGARWLRPFVRQQNTRRTLSSWRKLPGRRRMGVSRSLGTGAPGMRDFGGGAASMVQREQRQVPESRLRGAQTSA